MRARGGVPGSEEGGEKRTRGGDRRQWKLHLQGARHCAASAPRNEGAFSATERVLLGPLLAGLEVHETDTKCGSDLELPSTGH